MTRLIPKLSAAKRARFIAAARTFLTSNNGGPATFRHSARKPHKVDCLGLVVMAMRAIGYEVADRKNYGRDPVNDGLHEAAIAHFGNPIPKDTIRPGDVVLMRWHQQPNHVAIVTDHPNGGLALIHSLMQEGFVVEHRLSAPWPRRIIEAFRP